MSFPTLAAALGGFVVYKMISVSLGAPSEVTRPYDANNPAVFSNQQWDDKIMDDLRSSKTVHTVFLRNYQINNPIGKVETYYISLNNQTFYEIDSATLKELRALPTVQIKYAI